MIVDLAHVPHLTQRRADTPLNSLSESPQPDDAVELDVPPNTAATTPEPSTTDGDAASTSVPATSPNHAPNDAPSGPQENSDNRQDEPQWNITTKDSSGIDDSNRDNVDDANDKAAEDQSRSKPSASNLPKLIIPGPEQDQQSEKRKRRYDLTALGNGSGGK